MAKKEKTAPQFLSPSLMNYIHQGKMTEKQQALLLKYISKGGNIIVGGGTGSGKTHFLNSVLDETQRRRPKQLILVFSKHGENFFQLRGNFGLVLIPTWDEDVVNAISFANFTFERWQFFDDFGERDGWNFTGNWYKRPGHHAMTIHSCSLEELPRRLEMFVKRFMSEKQFDRVKRKTLFIQLTRDEPFFGSLPRIETAEWKEEKCCKEEVE